MKATKRSFKRYFKRISLILKKNFFKQQLLPLSGTLLSFSLLAKASLRGSI